MLGINHFTWFRAASWQGVDLFPLYRAFTEKYRETGFQEPGRNWLNSSFDCAHLVKFDLFRRFGWIAAAGDRHLAEFMPGDEYLADPETVARWKFGLTPVSWRKADLALRLEKSARLVRGQQLTELKPSGEEGVLLMKALLGLERVISNVNLPNAGQISNLPLGTVVETNAVFARDRITPLLAGPLSPEILELTLPHVENQALTLRAALEADPAPVVEAFLRDPNTRAKCRDRGALEALAADMIAATARFLPEAWRR